MNHGRLTRWSLTLQEYNLNWEYIPGKGNVIADTLSRINIRDQTFEGEKETIIKLYHIISNRSDLTNIITGLEQQQKQDPRLRKIFDRLGEQDDRITQFYCEHQQILFIKTHYKLNTWKIVIPQNIEKDLIMDYHIRYGHMGALKVVKALQEHVYIRDANRKVRNQIKHCHICQLVKVNNHRKEGTMMPITSSNRLE